MLRGLPTLACLELNLSTGELLCSTVSLESAKLDVLQKTGPIRCAAVDIEYTNLVTVGDDKQLKVWAIDSLQLLSERYVPCRFSSSVRSRLTVTRREIPKKPTQILFTRSGRTILVADKFGDVFRCVVPALTSPPAHVP
jgi:tRNA (guanine-N(7)-)-methyltransferase subunit TRM82